MNLSSVLLSVEVADRSVGRQEIRLAYRSTDRRRSSVANRQRRRWTSRRGARHDASTLKEEDQPKRTPGSQGLPLRIALQLVLSDTVHRAEVARQERICRPANIRMILSDNSNHSDETVRSVLPDDVSDRRCSRRGSALPTTGGLPTTNRPRSGRNLEFVVSRRLGARDLRLDSCPALPRGTARPGLKE